MEKSASDPDGKPVKVVSTTSEELFYNSLKTKEKFFTNFMTSNGFTAKQIKFFRSVMDGNLKFVKTALNQGSIRNDKGLMRAAICLSCRFGQPQVLDTLVSKVNEDFFKTENLSFVVVMIAGVSEANRLKLSGVLDILIKYGKKSYDKKTRKYINGKIDFDAPKERQNKIKGLRTTTETTAFIELCGINEENMKYIVEKLINGMERVVDVNLVLEETDIHVGNSALISATLLGTKEVVKILLDKMEWKETRDLEVFDQNHIQRVLGAFIYDFCHPSLYEKNHWFLFNRREDRMDIMHLLIEKCFRVTKKNKIGHDNDTFMEGFKKLFAHDHFDAMIFDVIEEGRRTAHVNGRLTHYDIEIKKLPNGFPNLIFRDDQFERYFRSVNDGYFNQEYHDQLKKEAPPKRRNECWSCGKEDPNYEEPDLKVCKQCRVGRYCDEQCQEEDWKNHQEWCKQKKEKLDEEREGETEEDKKWRKEFRQMNKERDKAFRNAKVCDYY